VKIPQNNTLAFCREIIEDCESNRKDRIQQGAMWRQ